MYLRIVTSEFISFACMSPFSVDTPSMRTSAEASAMSSYLMHVFG